MIVLGVSTSTPRATAALVRGGTVLGRAEHEALEEHAERLFGLIDAAIAAAGVDRAAIGAVACDVGPGSFTGVRVGVASALGVSHGLGVPAVGVGSLTAMARAAIARWPGALRVVAMLDAKKDEVFVETFDARLDPEGPARHVPRVEAAAWLEQARRDGALVVGAVADAIAPGVARRAPDVDLPDAVFVASRAAELLAAGGPLPPADPVYVRAPDARPAAPRGS